MSNAPKSIMNLEGSLRAKNINPTAMRLLVLSLLKEKNQALTFAEIEGGFDQSDRVTIYRTLKTFEQKGLIHAITVGNSTQYALCSDACSEEEHKDAHLHFICKECQKTICLTKQDIPEVQIPKGFKIDEIEVVIKGVCEDCMD